MGGKHARKRKHVQFYPAESIEADATMSSNRF
jgi:hypothetical protein